MYWVNGFETDAIHLKSCRPNIYDQIFGGYMMNKQTTFTQKSVVIADHYEKIDGRNAYQSDVECLSLGLSEKEEQKKRTICANIYKHSQEDGQVTEEIPVHRAIDLAILIGRSNLYFQDAYRLPKLYDPENPQIDRIGLQGDVMNVAICTENRLLDEDIQQFYQVLSEDGEMLGERLRVLSRLLEELGY